MIGVVFSNREIRAVGFVPQKSPLKEVRFIGFVSQTGNRLWCARLRPTSGAVADSYRAPTARKGCAPSSFGKSSSFGKTAGPPQIGFVSQARRLRAPDRSGDPVRANTFI